MTILKESLAALERTGLVAGQQITEIVPTASYVAVALTGGSVGWALCYAQLTRRELQGQITRLVEQSEDPLLRDLLFVHNSRDPLVQALRVALVAALADPVWRHPGTYGYVGRNGVPSALLARAEHALVVGFGGLMFTLLGQPQLRSLDVVDLTYAARLSEMQGVRDALALARPDVLLTLSDGNDLPAGMMQADFVAITGSALCNGTMEYLLGMMGARHTVVVQGQSAAIHPEPLFNRGVAGVISPEKPPAMLDAARRDPTGLSLSQWVEGGLQATCLLPRTPQALAGPTDKAARLADGSVSAISW